MSSRQSFSCLSRGFPRCAAEPAPLPAAMLVVGLVLGLIHAAAALDAASVGVIDWQWKQTGAPHTSIALSAKRQVWATDQDVVAGVATRSGRLDWRFVLPEGEPSRLAPLLALLAASLGLSCAPPRMLALASFPQAKAWCLWLRGRRPVGLWLTCCRARPRAACFAVLTPTGARPSGTFL